jgi:pimeloyl-ACP methyl ester carboxylesterase
MKLLLLPFLLLFVTSSFAQQNKFTGIWEGKISVGITLRLVFEFKADEKGNLSGILRSPDQSPKPLPIDTTYVSGDSIYTIAKKIGVTFSGKLSSDTTIDGAFVQGITIPLSLKKVASVEETKRPQTPQPPFGYESKEVIYYNADRSIKFSGTLTWPAIPAGTDFIKQPIYPAVLLITGSGPQDRDETMLLHKPFAVMADHLTKKGFAVLRVDDRGVGKTTGDFATATTADFAKDVEAGIDFLKTEKEVDSNKIGLLGHSEGGMIAPMVASRRKDVKFIVLLAGPGVPIKQLMSEQIYAAGIAEGNSEKISRLGSTLYSQAMSAIQSSSDTSTMQKKIVAQLKKDYPANKNLYDSLELNTTENQRIYASQRVKALTATWYKYFAAFDPTPYLQKLSCDVLALNGSKDVQVLATSNLQGIRSALKKSRSKKYKVEEIAGLNHLFQDCKKCSVKEYGELEETLSPTALQMISDWLEGEK